MPGIDKSRIINVSDNDDELLCLAEFINPLKTPCCRQIYCNDYIMQWQDL